MRGRTPAHPRAHRYPPSGSAYRNSGTHNCSDAHGYGSTHRNSGTYGRSDAHGYGSTHRNSGTYGRSDARRYGSAHPGACRSPGL